MKNVISIVPRTLSHGENTITNPCEIANVFHNYLTSVADTAKQNIDFSYKTFLNTYNINALILHLSTQQTVRK